MDKMQSIKEVSELFNLLTKIIFHNVFLFAF